MEYLVSIGLVYVFVLIMCLLWLLITPIIGLFSPALAIASMKNLDTFLGTITLGLWHREPALFRKRPENRRQLFASIPPPETQAEHAKLIANVFISDHQIWFKENGTLAVHIRSRDESKNVVLYLDRHGVYDIQMASKLHPLPTISIEE